MYPKLHTCVKQKMGSKGRLSSVTRVLAWHFVLPSAPADTAAYSQQNKEMIKTANKRMLFFFLTVLLFDGPA